MTFFGRGDEAHSHDARGRDIRVRVHPYVCQDSQVMGLQYSNILRLFQPGSAS